MSSPEFKLGKSKTILVAITKIKLLAEHDNFINVMD